jgi:hypothetical protein
VDMRLMVGRAPSPDVSIPQITAAGFCVSDGQTSSPKLLPKWDL